MMQEVCVCVQYVKETFLRQICVCQFLICYTIFYCLHHYTHNIRPGKIELVIIVCLKTVLKLSQLLLLYREVAC